MANKIGVQPRTQEILQTLNLRHRLDIQGNHVSETAFWSRSEPTEDLKRTHIGGEIVNRTPYPFILSIPQRETERAFDENLQSYNCEVTRPCSLMNFHYVEEDADYPLRVTVKDLYSNVTKVIRTKYLLGTDGATSTTRRLMGLESNTYGPDDIWCVADLKLNTDFPDVRRRCAIRSPAGGIMMIPNPRDGNRIYTQLNVADLASLADENMANGKAGSGVANASVSGIQYSDVALLQLLSERVKAILNPYEIEIKELFWISQYRLRQRIVEDFWDSRRVFILGDACHTHSPKAAQGLNVSMGDAYNLTWKLALVIKGHASATLLKTYATERRGIAQELLDFDAKFSHLFACKSFLDNSAFHDVYAKAHGFTSGIGQEYPLGPLTLASSQRVHVNEEAVGALLPGRRLHPANLRRHIDGTALNLLDDLPSNGRFHLFILAGNAISQRRFQPVIDYLASKDSAISKFESTASPNWGFEDIYFRNPLNEGRVVDLFLLHTDDHYSIDLLRLPHPLPQWKYRVYVDEDAKEHANYGVNVSQGAMALVRPDGVLSLVCGLDESILITRALESFLM